MLIVTGTFEVAPDGVAAAKAAMTAMMAATRQEAGCLTYEFSQTVEEPLRFRVYEEWTDAAALKAHGASPHMADYRAAMAAAGVHARAIVMTEAGEKTRLG